MRASFFSPESRNRWRFMKFPIGLLLCKLYVCKLLYGPKKSKYLLMCSGEGKKSCLFPSARCVKKNTLWWGQNIWLFLCGFGCEKAPIWCTIVFLYEQPKFKSGSSNLWSHLHVFFLSPLCSITISDEMQNIVSSLTHFLMIYWCIWHTLSYSS